VQKNIHELYAKHPSKNSVPFQVVEEVDADPHWHDVGARTEIKWTEIEIKQRYSRHFTSL